MREVSNGLIYSFVQGVIVLIMSTVGVEWSKNIINVIEML